MDSAKFLKISNAVFSSPTNIPHDFVGVILPNSSSVDTEKVNSLVVISISLESLTFWSNLMALHHNTNLRASVGTNLGFISSKVLVYMFHLIFIFSLTDIYSCHIITFLKYTITSNHCCLREGHWLKSWTYENVKNLQSWQYLNDLFVPYFHFDLFI